MDNTLTPRGAEEIFGERDAAVAPVGVADRIDTLDFIRGLAVMGILAANIVAFGQPMEAYMYPAAFLTDAGDPGGWMWIVQFILIDGKLVTVRQIHPRAFEVGQGRASARIGTHHLRATRAAEEIAVRS